MENAAAEGVAALRGDATAEMALRAAAIEKAAHVIVDVDKDDTVVLICLTAKHLNSALDVVAAAKEAENIPCSTATERTRWWRRRWPAAAGEAIDGQVAQDGITFGTDGMVVGGWDADQVAGGDREDGDFLAFDGQHALPLQHVEDLLGVMMHVQRRRLARLRHHDEALEGGGFRAVHHQVVDVGEKGITRYRVGREDIAHGDGLLLPARIRRY